MLKYLNLLPLLLIASICTGCGDEDQNQLPTDAKGAESFDAFYQRFLEDSVFQLSRITFPLRSEVPIGERPLSDKGYYIKKKDWELNIPIDRAAQPDVTVKFEDWDGLVIERVEIGGFFYVERRYGLNLEKKWELIYYSGMQEMSNRLDKLVEPEIRKQESSPDAEAEVKME